MLLKHKSAGWPNSWLLLLQDPALAASLAKPRVQQALQAISTSPWKVWVSLALP